MILSNGHQRYLVMVLLLWSSGLRAEDEHPSTGFQCESTTKVDIGILADVSKSIDPEEFKIFKSFLTQVVSNFHIGPDKVQIGLLEYSDRPVVKWFLNNHQTKPSLLEAIDKLPQNGGGARGTRIGLALRFLLRYIFDPSEGMRADSKKIAILITGEEFKDNVFGPSQLLRDKDIEIYTVGVKNSNETQLRAIASDPAELHLYSIGNFLFLLDIVDNFTINLCNSVTSLVSVRLVDGTSQCSGRLEVKSEQSWSSVCEADFDRQDAEVVCREVGCGASSVLQGALYEEAGAPMWTKEFLCGGNESALLDCGQSDSARSTCSSGKAAGLRCSEPIRLVGGASRCSGILEVKLSEWRPVYSDSDWTLKDAAVACRELDCGAAVSTGSRGESLDRPVWWIRSDCVQSGSTLRDCATLSRSSSTFVELTCSDSVRLVNGTSLCSGRLEVKSEQSWSLVGQEDFDWQDAEVVCRELGCGVPSVLQGALYGDVEAPMWTKEFQCGGNESALLNCTRSDSARSTFSSSKAAGLTCSEKGPLRLMGGASRCEGTLEVKLTEWRPVMSYSDWTLKDAAVVCSELDCGSAVSTGWRKESSDRPVWRIRSDCVQSGSTLRDCAASSDSSSYIMEVICSDLLLQPIISVSSTIDGVSEAQQQGFQVFQGFSFTISCSIQPQYPGGAFLLTFTSSNAPHNYTQSAVNHSADFLFPDADPAHQGNYTCVYGVYVFAHNFSSEGLLLSLTVSDPTPVIIRLVVLLGSLLLVVSVVIFILKTCRGQPSVPRENTEVVEEADGA